MPEWAEDRCGHHCRDRTEAGARGAVVKTGGRSPGFSQRETLNKGLARHEGGPGKGVAKGGGPRTGVSGSWRVNFSDEWV